MYILKHIILFNHDTDYLQLELRFSTVSFRADSFLAYLVGLSLTYVCFYASSYVSVSRAVHIHRAVMKRGVMKSWRQGRRGWHFNLQRVSQPPTVVDDPASMFGKQIILSYEYRDVRKNRESSVAKSRPTSKILYVSSFMSYIAVRHFIGQTAGFRHETMPVYTRVRI